MMMLMELEQEARYHQVLAAHALLETAWGPVADRTITVTTVVPYRPLYVSIQSTLGVYRCPIYPGRPFTTGFETTCPPVVPMVDRTRQSAARILYDDCKVACKPTVRRLGKIFKAMPGALAFALNAYSDEGFIRTCVRAAPLPLPRFMAPRRRSDPVTAEEQVPDRSRLPAIERIDPMQTTIARAAAEAQMDEELYYFVVHTSVFMGRSEVQFREFKSRVVQWIDQFRPNQPPTWKSAMVLRAMLLLQKRNPHEDALIDSWRTDGYFTVNGRYTETHRLHNFSRGVIPKKGGPLRRLFMRKRALPSH